MGPKPKGQRAEKQATTFKAIDDFLEKSSVAPGEVRDQLASAHEEQQVKKLKEKYFDAIAPNAMANNLKQITKCRTLTLIFGGTTAGIFGFDGLQGMMFYLALITIVSFAILAGLGFKGKPYFTKMSEAATTGLFSNLLTYLLMWVMFYNLVYVL